jgi:hypothetical protein
MDPNANLTEQLELAGRIIELTDAEDVVDIRETARLAELVLSLNKWIRNGGFLPEIWTGGEKKPECEHMPDYETIGESPKARGVCILMCVKCKRGGYFAFSNDGKAEIHWTGPILEKRTSG